MFTGIIQELAEVTGFRSSGSAARLEVRLGSAGEIETGESIAVNGVCLTVSHKGAGGVSFDVVGQTLELTTLKGLESGENQLSRMVEKAVNEIFEGDDPT